ncbi:MAG: hypothetical protein QOG60_725 [Frankiaceae bacterium]|nr:hypothetical protein [Frankiaceae bacterium]
MAVPEVDAFRALADPNRRRLLDLLREKDGRTLGELVAGLDMARQSATQHLGVLEDANLVTVVWQGRQKLHYLNPVPLHEITERWIDQFAQPRLRALSQIRRDAEDSQMTTNPLGPDDDRPSFRYVTYIRASAEQVWDSLTDADLTAAFWGHANHSDWQVGSRWEHVRVDGSGIRDVVGTVLESDRPRRLAITFDSPDSSGAPAEVGESAVEPSVVTFELRPHHDIVELTVTHRSLPSAGDLEAAAIGWASVMSNLKTLLETGVVLPQAPWEMHAELAAEQMARNDPR